MIPVMCLVNHYTMFERLVSSGIFPVMKFHMLKLFLMEKVIPDEDFGGFSSPCILGI